ncbi:chain-length determining protein [Bryobacterales bacterium F-183]|nr:chain-length determining protein [Bryobacterales bacterium F-183]
MRRYQSDDITGRAIATVNTDSVRLLGAAKSPGGSSQPHELIQHAHLLLRNAPWIVLLTLGGGLTGFFYMLTQTPGYRASTVIEIQGVNEAFMNLDRAAPQGGVGDYGPNLINIQTQLKLIESPSLIARTVANVRSNRSADSGPREDRYSDLRSLLGIKLATTAEESLEMAAKTIAARPIAGTRLVEISADSSDPVTAATFVNSLSEEFITGTLRARTSGVLTTSKWVDQQVVVLRNELALAEAKLQSFVRGNDGVFASPQDTLAEARLHQLKEQQVAIQAERMAKQAKFEANSAGGVGSIAELQNDIVLQSLESEKAKIKLRWNELGTKLTPQHQRMVTLQAQLDDIQTQIDTRRAGIAAKLRTEFEAVQRNEALLGEAYRKQTNRAIGETAKTATYNSLKREAEQAREALSAMLQQQRQTGILAVLPTNNIRIVDAASAPLIAFKPRASVLVGWGLVSGFMIAVIFAFARDKVRQRVHAPGFVGDILDLPEIAIIPSQSPVPWSRRIAARANPLLLDDAATSVELASHYQRSTHLAESFRGALGSLLFGEGGRKAPKVIVVTSPRKGEGKTTVTSNLAITLAQTGRRVVLIDADLRAPRMHSIFGAENNRGLAEFVAAAEGEIRTADVIHPTAYEMLSLVPAGFVPANISATVCSPRLAGLIRDLSRIFDTVIIDTPPVLGLVDTRIFSRLADGVILVVRSGMTEANDILAARDLFRQDGAPLIGTILNDWKPSSLDGGRYGASYYSQQGPSK